MEITQNQKSGLERYLKKISNGEFLDVKVKIKKGNFAGLNNVFVYVTLNKPSDNPLYDHYLTHVYEDKIMDFFKMIDSPIDGSIYFEIMD